MRKRLAQLFCLLSAPAGMIVLFGGCLFGFSEKPYVAVKYYDLANPPQILLTGNQVNILAFDSTEPAKYKMIYRGKNNEMIMDDYNKWIQPPCLLLTRYLQSAFKQSGPLPKDSVLLISGNVFMFRIDLQTNTASLGVNYVIKGTPDNIIRPISRNSIVFSSKFEKQGPIYFVRAMSECAGQLVSALDKDIKSIKPNEIKAGN
ncbi:MAG: hypothetical protein PHV82_08355 [Victivallaceae bacterium]|nr:hypothetical protein [Victivallaceae bacterium]